MCLELLLLKPMRDGSYGASDVSAGSALESHSHVKTRWSL
jgi:hypothetical protein